MTRATAAAWTVVAEWAPFEPDWIALGTDSSHLTAIQCRVTAALGKAAAHGLFDRERFEVIVRRWCRLRPGLKGGSADHLCWSFDTARAAEDTDCTLAERRITGAVWPLFEALAARAAIREAAHDANSGVLDADEIEAVLAWVAPRATRKWRA